MKKILILAFASLLFLSCGNSKKGPVAFSGKIENNTADSVLIINNDIRKTMAVNSNGFSDTLNIKQPGYFRFYAGNEYTWVYMEPGAKIVLKTDMNQFDNQLKFEGSLAKENNYLAQKTIEEQKLSGNPSAFFSQDIDSYVKNLDNYKKELQSNLEKSGSSKSFVELENKNIDFVYWLFLAQYPEAHSFFTKQRIELPETLKTELEKINLDNEADFEMIPSYKDLVLYQYSIKIDQSKSGDEVEQLIANIKSQKIKDEIISSLLMYTISSGGPEAQKYFDILKKYSKDEDLIKRATVEFEQIKKLLPGSPSPQFNFPDINGKNFSLDDLKGKLVYIDVWATWCVPCLQEIPSLKKLETDYHDKDIYFVSMSIDQKKDFEKWQKMVKEDNLQGIQIFSDNDWKSQFVREYNINGIPRFILLDKEGKIITADAPRPSNPEIRELFDKHI